MADDITRHLAGLNEEVLMENMASWEAVLARIEKTLTQGASKYWTHEKLDFIRAVADTREARLFRAGLVRVYLTISTAPKQGLQRGDFYLRLIWNEQNIPVVEYGKFGRTSFQNYKLNTYDDPLFLMLPHLRRLWYDSKRKPE